MRLFSYIAFIFMLGGITAAVPSSYAPIPADTRVVGTDPLDNMQIVEGGYDKHFYGSVPIEQRGPEFARWMAPSVKIAVSGGSGSGTICYYDPVKNLAYVASCGHLWDKGVMTVEEGKKRHLTCQIIPFYKNEEKLKSLKSYEGKVIFYSYIRGCDTSLVTFEPDWTPEYFPIAPVNYNIPPGTHQHSVGCDGGREVAHYDVEIVGIQGPDLITQQNSPRPGRSGGGLMSDDGYYIGTCWGTSDTRGTGIGYFTPLSVIHNFWNKQAGYAFLLNVQPVFARLIPIVDQTGATVFPKDFVPIPGKR